VVDKSAMIEPLQKRFGRLAERNIKAFERAYKETKIL
jgi:Pyruvate/2-oxoacid:ferredoxin oxidoreductase gamma subunit